MAKKGSLFHMLAGILFAVLALRESYLFIMFLINNLGRFDIFSPFVIMSVIQYLMFMGAYTLTAGCLLIGSFLKKRGALAKLLTLVGLAALALTTLISFFIGFVNSGYYAGYYSGHHFNYFVFDLRYGYNHFNLFCVLPALLGLTACAALLGAAVILPRALAKDPNSKLRLAAFLPALLVLSADFMTYFIGFVLRQFFALMWFPGSVSFTFGFFVTLFFKAVYLAAVALAGLGCAFPAVREE